MIETSKVRTGALPKSMLDWSVAGTLDYAPPEQLGKRPDVPLGPYSDVYAFARTCSYAMFKATELRRKQWDGLPGPLADLLEGCLDPDPQKRPNGFDLVVKVLGECTRALEEKRRRTQEERLRREQEEEQRRQQEGEEQLRRLVRAALDRAEGKLTADDATAAKDLGRQSGVPEERARAIILHVEGQWQRERPRQLREMLLKDMTNVALRKRYLAVRTPELREEDRRGGVWSWVGPQILGLYVGFLTPVGFFLFGTIIFVMSGKAGVLLSSELSGKGGVPLSDVWQGLLFVASIGAFIGWLYGCVVMSKSRDWRAEIGPLPSDFLYSLDKRKVRQKFLGE